MKSNLVKSRVLGLWAEGLTCTAICPWCEALGFISPVQMSLLASTATFIYWCHMGNPKKDQLYFLCYGQAPPVTGLRMNTSGARPNPAAFVFGGETVARQQIVWVGS